MSDRTIISPATSSWVEPSPTPTSTPIPTSTPRPNPSRHPARHTELILGITGVFLSAVALLFLVTVCLHLFRRKKRTRRDTVSAETMTDHEMNVYVQFPMSTVIAKHPAARPEGQPHPRPSTLPLHRSRPSSAAVQAAGLGGGEYEALLPATASMEMQESDTMYEPVCSSVDSEEFYHEPTPIRIQMAIANAEAAAKSTTLDGRNIPVELHPAKEEQRTPERVEERLYENIVIGRKTNPDELYI